MNEDPIVALVPEKGSDLRAAVLVDPKVAIDATIAGVK